MTSITDLSTKIEAAKIAGNGITLSNDELHGLLSIAALLGGGPAITNNLAVNAPRDADEECITIEEICRKLKVTRQTLWRWRKDGTFTPQPVDASGRRWLHSEFSEWLRERQA